VCSVPWFKSWLGQPDQFDWITDILRERGIIRSAQWTLAIVSSMTVLVPVTSFLSTHRPTAEIVLVDATAGIFILGVSVFWLTRWPTRLQSQMFGVVGALCIAGWSLTQPTVTLTALGCCAMATNGGYIALFHSNKLLAFNVAVAIPVGTVVAAEVASEYDIGTALAALWVISILNLSSPLVMRGMSRAMGTYAVRADQDALTGLLNRRGFITTLTRRLAEPRPNATHLTVVMIDLDAFKRVNDTFGHSAGDRALTAVADVLREHMAPTSVLCRAGGEEFLIAAVGPEPDADAISAQLRSAIATLPHQVTASIGTATAELPALGIPDLPGFIEKLVDAADTAMYTAKRRGGNQAHHF
jgi:diguanylate cyclase (GGDEF)-like protein